MTLTKVIAINRAVDPSQTTVLRNAFARVMRNKFNKFTNILSQVIVRDDVFGLIANRIPGPRAFSFPRSSEKVAAFIKWLSELTNEEILQITRIDQVGQSVNAAWSNLYIQDSYKRGVMRARAQLRGLIPSLHATGGIGVVLLDPAHVDRLGLLFTRTFTELKGITDAMAQQIGRVLAEGIAKGLEPRMIAKQLNQVITGIGEDLSVTDSLGRYIPARRRAEMLARTEIIRAHAEAQLQEFENWGIQGVSAKAEILTANDNRVCPRCLALEKKVLSIEEARGVIPLHPDCRCIWIPFIEN